MKKITTSRKASSPIGVAVKKATTARKSSSNRQIVVNKHGQSLGRKGSETRQRLMDAARRLLSDHSPLTLTAVSVAKEAETSSATFYIYFDDVREILYALSEAASADLSEVHRILEEDWDTSAPDVDHAQRVVDTFNGVWKRHRDILRFRNLEADRGDQDFLDQRISSSVRIIDRIAERILAGYTPEQRPPRIEAYAEAATLFGALEGQAAVDPAVMDSWPIGEQRFSRAAAKLLARSFAGKAIDPNPPKGAAAAAAVAPKSNRLAPEKRVAQRATPQKPASAPLPAARKARSRTAG
jgi:AcrR family transcriptional regulator